MPLAQLGADPWPDVDMELVELDAEMVCPTVLSRVQYSSPHWVSQDLVAALNLEWEILGGMDRLLQKREGLCQRPQPDEQSKELLEADKCAVPPFLLGAFGAAIEEELLGLPLGESPAGAHAGREEVTVAQRSAVPWKRWR
ncbi:hypothetical protein lerEdw1_009492 [Lerista edwardsae]|nr:hypothetical protein lerEdw1_009492 [Lerista edwardsae]